MLLFFVSYQIRIGFSDGCNTTLLHHEVVSLTKHFLYEDGIKRYYMGIKERERQKKETHMY